LIESDSWSLLLNDGGSMAIKFIEDIQAVMENDPVAKGYFASLL